MDAIDRFVEAARAAGLDPQPTRFPEGTRTAADAAAAVGCDIGQIVKSLVFMAGEEPLLVLTSGANRVDEVVVAAALGTGSLSKASAEEVRDATGFAIGGTPPLGHATPLRTLVDRDLLRYDEVWAAAGTPDSCFPVPPADLARAAGAQVVAVTAASAASAGD